MKYYLDITLLPSDDIGVHFLWSKVMMQVHLALVEVQDEHATVPVAVSFPQYVELQKKAPAFLGHRLRLFARNNTDLERLNIQKWMNRLTDYVHIKGINQVPETDRYESFSRRTVTGSADKLIRRRMKRHKETLDQATLHYEGYQASDVSKADKKLPFIQMKSLTSQNEFCLNILRSDADPTGDKEETFNTYGLNAKGVIPKF